MSGSPQKFANVLVCHQQGVFEIFHKRQEIPTGQTVSFPPEIAGLIERQMILQSAGLTAQQLLNRSQINCLEQLEFKVFSQFGDDGIITYLASFVPKEHRRFIEFGVEDYREANTRLLLERDNWSGLILDGSQTYIESVKNRPDYWRYDLHAESAFLTTENINDLFQKNGFTGTIGLLSVDIDGNDYWIWKAIEVIKPLIVVCEYNAVFGDQAAVTIPYESGFQRTEKHFSNLYAGCSLAALCQLATSRGLQFVGCNRAGNNAYFIDPILDTGLPALDVQTGFVDSRFREARNEQGELILRPARDCLNLIADLPLWDLGQDAACQVKDVVQQ